MPQQQLIADCITRYAAEPGGLLPLLHAIQEVVGYIPPETIADIASSLSLSQAEVHGVISFYHDFRTSPGGLHRVQVCRAEACQAMGSEAVAARASDLLEIEFGETTEDGRVTLEPVYCLGNCACSPSVRIGDEVYGRVSEERLERLLEKLREPGT